jgi:hypothetical protein
MVFGMFDFLTVIVVVVLNIFYFQNKKFDTTLGCGFVFLVFGILLPALSIDIEERRETKDWKEGEIHDNFELLYLFLKFPIYWGMGIIQSIIFHYWKNKKGV